MKTSGRLYFGWAVAGAAVLAGIGLLANNISGKSQIYPATPGQSKIKETREQPLSRTNQTPGPYITSGGNEEQNDNFYIPGQISGIASLASKDKNTIVWISASWCEVCHAMRPFVAKTANKYADKLALKEINFNDNYNNIILPNNWFGTPIFLVLDRDGNIKDSFSGATEETFNAKLKAASEL